MKLQQHKNEIEFATKIKTQNTTQHMTLNESENSISTFCNWKSKILNHLYYTCSLLEAQRKGDEFGPH